MQRNYRKQETNYRVVLLVGKTIERAHRSDGKGKAKNLEEAKTMFDSVRKKTRDVLQAELYFQDKLIKKV